MSTLQNYNTNAKVIYYGLVRTKKIELDHILRVLSLSKKDLDLWLENKKEISIDRYKILERLKRVEAS